MPKHFTLNAEPAELLKDASAGALLRRLIRRAWRWLIWRTRVTLRLRAR